MKIQTILILLSSFSFLCFGAACLTTEGMRTEFHRYGLEKFRVLTGTLQFLAGVGLIVGFKFHLASQISSLGLFILMLLGLGVRLKIKDSFLQTLPAFLYMVLNLYIFINL